MHNNIAAIECTHSVFYFNPSDSTGLGYILLINHMPMLYAPEDFLGDRLATYGLSFSAFLRISNTGALNINTTIIRLVGGV